MEPAQKKQHIGILNLRKSGQKLFTGSGAYRSRVLDSERGHRFAATIKPERTPGIEPFLFRSEYHGSGIAQHAVFSPGPVTPLLNMFQRECPFKPGIEHAVREDIVGRRCCAPKL